MVKIVLYGVGGFAVTVASFGFMQWAQYLYSPPEGTGWEPLIPIAWFGWLTLFGRSVDALSNLLLPYYCDRGVPLLGRRKGFIMVGGVVCGILTFLLFSFPSFTRTSGILLWILFLLFGGFFLFFTMATAPYLALLAEIGKNPAERIRYALVYAFFTFSAVLFVFTAGILVEKRAFLLLGSLFALSVILPFLTAAISTGEPKDVPPLTTALLPAVKQLIFHPAFRLLVATMTLNWAGFVILIALLPYIIRVWWRMDERVFFAVGIIVILSAMSGLLLTHRFVSILGKKRVYINGLSLLASGIFALLFAHYFSGIWFYLVLLGIFLVVGVNVAMMVGVPNALLADIAAEDALAGEGKAALMFGISGLMNKIGQGIAIASSTQILALFGYSPENSTGILLSIVLSLLLLVISIVIFFWYPKSE